MRGRRIAILRALTRPALLLHCDRELLLTFGGLALFGFVRLGLVESSLGWMVGSALFLALVITVLIWAAKKDPQWKDILLRSWRYLPPWQSESPFSRTPRWDAPPRRRE